MVRGGRHGAVISVFGAEKKNIGNTTDKGGAMGRKLYDVSPFVEFRTWLILDSRAHTDPNGASLYGSFSERGGWTAESVTKVRDKEWPDGVVFEYDELEKEDGTHLINQRRI